MPSMQIEYCVVRNYHPRAAGLAAEIQEQFGFEPTLVKGKDGVFEVTLDGELIFSKRSRGRFPEPGEVAVEVKKRVA